MTIEELKALEKSDIDWCVSAYISNMVPEILALVEAANKTAEWADCEDGFMYELKESVDAFNAKLESL